LTTSRLQCHTLKSKQEHGNLIPIQGSTTSHADLQRAVDHISNETGYIDLLINNAGQTTFDSSPDARPKPTPESSAAEVRDYYFNYRPYEVWNQTLDTNVAAVFATSMAFLELLVEGNKRREKDSGNGGKGKGKPSSQIIAIGSVGGLTRFTDSFIYNASKAAVHHLMKNLGAHFVPFDVRCNVIAPGCEFVLFLSCPTGARTDNDEVSYHDGERSLTRFFKRFRVPLRHDNPRHQSVGAHGRRDATDSGSGAEDGSRSRDGRHGLVPGVQSGRVRERQHQSYRWWIPGESCWHLLDWFVVGWVDKWIDR
jgi:NAD(P)-dependent dehydrogenase (short-subunit alcohol dehydrogenase family)